MLAPTVTNDGLNVKIAWIAPNLNSGTLANYRIRIRNSLGVYVEDLTVCDGTDALIKSQQYCTVALTYLRNVAKYNLAFNELVQARV